MIQVLSSVLGKYGLKMSSTCQPAKETRAWRNTLKVCCKKCKFWKQMLTFFKRFCSTDICMVFILNYIEHKCKSYMFTLIAGLTALPQGFCNTISNSYCCQILFFHIINFFLSWKRFPLTHYEANCSIWRSLNIRTYACVSVNSCKIWNILMQVSFRTC